LQQIDQNLQSPNRLEFLNNELNEDPTRGIGRKNIVEFSIPWRLTVIKDLRTWLQEKSNAFCLPKFGSSSTTQHAA